LFPDFIFLKDAVLSNTQPAETNRHEEGVFLSSFVLLPYQLFRCINYHIETHIRTCRLASNDLTTTVKVHELFGFGPVINGPQWNSHLLRTGKYYSYGVMGWRQLTRYMRKFFRTSVHMQLYASLQPEHFGAYLTASPATNKP